MRNKFCWRLIRRLRPSPRIAWIMKGTLSASLICYIFTRIDHATTWRQVQSVTWEWVLLAGIAQILQMLIGGLRWHFVLSFIGASLSLRLCTVIFYIGTFFNLVIPGAIGGDGYRIWCASRHDVNFNQAFNSVILDRIATVLMLLLLITLMQPVFSIEIGSMPASWVFPLLTGGTLLALVMLMNFHRLPASLPHAPVTQGIAALALDTQRIFLRPIPTFLVLFWAFIGHVNLALVAWLIALGLHLPVTLLDCLILIPPVILLTTLPISIAGWGIREGAMVTALHLVSIDSASALLLSILMGIVGTLVSIPGGIVWLVTHPGRRSELDKINHCPSH